MTEVVTPAPLDISVESTLSNYYHTTSAASPLMPTYKNQLLCNQPGITRTPCSSWKWQRQKHEKSHMVSYKRTKTTLCTGVSRA